MVPSEALECVHCFVCLRELGVPNFQTHGRCYPWGLPDGFSVLSTNLNKHEQLIHDKCAPI